MEEKRERHKIHEKQEKNEGPRERRNEPEEREGQKIRKRMGENEMKMDI